MVWNGFVQYQYRNERIHMKKFIAEFIGTLTLVVLGCGTAMLVGCNAAAGCGYIFLEKSKAQ